MKNINWKNITKGVSVGLLLLALFVSTQEVVIAQQTDATQEALRNNRFLGQSGNARSDQAGILDIAQFELAPKSQDVSVNLPGISLMDKGFLGNNLPVLFRQYGTAIFDNIAAYGDTAVEYLNAGFSTIQPETPGSAKLKVNGSIKIESFADGDPYDSRLRPVCHNDAGILSIDCGVIDETPPTAENGVCVVYSGTYATQPATDTASGCQVGNFVDVVNIQTDTVHRWACYGIDGGLTADCTAAQDVVLDPVDLGASASRPLSISDRLHAFIFPQSAEAASSICSERDKLNDNGVYKKAGSAYIRYSDKLSFIASVGAKKNLDYDLLQKSGLVTTKQVAIYADDSAQTLLPNGEYLISGDSVINEKRDPLQDDDGVTVPSGTPISAVSLVVQNGNYSFEACDETPYLTDDEIRDKDIAAIQTELEKYYSKNGRYPKTSGTGAKEPNSAWANSASGSWAKVATTLGLSALPLDPKNEAEDTATTWTGDQRYALYVDETYGGCNNPGKSYILTARFDNQSVTSPGAPTCNGGRNYFKKTVGECKDPACNASWFTGSWGTCSAGTQTRIVECRGSDNLKTRVTKPCETQDGSKPAETQSCASPAICGNFASSYTSQPATSSNGCSVGGYSDVSDTASEWRWSCAGLNGGSNASCSATRTTYSWKTSNWGTCNTSTGTQSRLVYCQDSTGTNVDNSLCTGTQPAGTQSCAVSGSCQTYNSTYAAQPATNSATACNNGTYKDVSDSTTEFKWQCLGLSGGAAQNCSASKINTNPVSEYRFDSCEYSNSVGEVIDSVGGLNATPLNGITTIDTTSKIGRALDNNAGINQTTNIPHSSKLSFDSQMSVSFWINPDARPTGYAAHVLNKWTNTSDANYVAYYFGDTAGGAAGGLAFYANKGGSWGAITSRYVLPLNTWTHIAMTYDEIEGGTLYVNGSVYGTQGVSSGKLANNTQQVGLGNPGFNGQLDEVKIYGDRLSASNISSIYSSENSTIRTIDCLSNDEKRERDIADIKALLEAYYNKNGSYPYSAGSIEPNSGWENSGSSEWDKLATTLGVAELPKDPINEIDGPAGDWANEYRYYYYSRGYGCGGDWYMLYHKSEDNPSQTVGNVRSCSQIFTYGGLIGTGECKSEFCNSSWSTGSWGTCSAGTQTRTVQCVGDKGTVTTDANCKYAGTKPATSQNCATAGVCAKFTGNYTSQPASASNGCTAGTYSDQIDGSSDLAWNWQCTGINGGATASCSANYLHNGSCGSSNGGTYTSTPSFTCGFGQTANVTDSSAADGTWNWSCNGVNGGSAVNCSANYRRNAVCKSYTGSYTTEPAVDTKTACTVGTFKDTSDTTTKWQWDCTGQNGGSNASCSATRTTYSWKTSNWGTCNTSTGTQSRLVYCQDSTGTNVDNSLCTGTQPAGTQSCAVSGSCKPFTGNYTSQPATTTSAGCSTGTYNNATNTSTQFKWTCSGLNGGGTSICSANWQRAGSCKSFTGNYTSQPATTTSAGCSLGNYTNVSNTNSAWRWSCSGINGGSTTTCNANTQYYWSTGSFGSCNSATGTQTRIVTCRSHANNATVSDSLCSGTKPAVSQSCAVNASCKSYTSTYSSQPATDTKSGCNSGAYSNGIDSSTKWNWSCSGLNGGSNASCSATKTASVVHGSCQSYKGTYSSQPATDTKSGCNSGTYKNLTDDKSNWNWQCAGSSGGLTATCSATKGLSGGGGGPTLSCDPEKSCCYLDSKGNWVEGPPCV